MKQVRTVLLAVLIKTNQVRKLANEQFIQFAEGKKRKYAISNMGRVISFVGDFEDSKVLKTSATKGYSSISLILKSGKETKPYIHKLVAEKFIENEDGHQKVIHLNHNKKDNKVGNLKWSSHEEVVAHQKESPHWKHYVATRDNANRITNSKLTTTEVMRIKKMLNRKVMKSTIAKRFSISAMQVHRIATGENWGNVKV